MKKTEMICLGPLLAAFLPPLLFWKKTFKNPFSTVLNPAIKKTEMICLGDLADLPLISSICRADPQDQISPLWPNVPPNAMQQIHYDDRISHFNFCWESCNGVEHQTQIFGMLWYIGPCRLVPSGSKQNQDPCFKEDASWPCGEFDKIISLNFG